MNAKVTTTDITDAAERQFHPGKLILVSQAAGCLARLNELCPSDQERVFRARWTEAHVLTFEEIGVATCDGDAEYAAETARAEGIAERAATAAGEGETDEQQAAATAAADAAMLAARAAAVAAHKKKLHNVSNANLQEMAARLSVAWLADDSRDTKLQKIAEAQAAAAA